MAGKLTKRDHFTGTGPVRYQVETSRDGVLRARLSIDYTDAPIPPHYYVADYFEVANHDPQVLFVFGKYDYPRRDRLRNKVEIDFPAALFIAQLWKSRAQFHETLRSFVQQNRYETMTTGDITEPVEKVQTVHANNALMVLAGGECMADFFYISPKDLTLRPQRGQDITLEPLVRIITTPNLLLGFLDACEPIAEVLMPKYGQDEEEEVSAVQR